jgi:hypothetical protein
MNFVDEQNCGLAFIFETIGSGGEDAAHIGDVGFNTAEALEFVFGLKSDDLGERSFSGAGRAIKNEGLNAIGFDGATKKLARREDVGLTDEIVEVARTHSRCQGLVGRRLRFGSQLGFCRGGMCEQVIASHGQKIG